MASSSVCLTVALADRSYPIEIAPSLWERIPAVLTDHLKARKVHLITDTHVAPLYEAKVRQPLESAGVSVGVHTMPAGEQHKTLATVERLYHSILTMGCDRKTPIIALGGGVVGDTAGFVAATLLRGLDFIQIPTTLLAMVDSSVGGKTGVDMPQGKNLVGAFHQPCHVFISTDTLSTLPRREVNAGLAEVVKYGVIRDADFLDTLEQNLDAFQQGCPQTRADWILRCCQIKADVVSRDERESGLREILNFGHTVGHAIETAGAYDALLHGEAVAIGMVVETLIACRMGYPLENLVERLVRLLSRMDLPCSPPPQDPNQVWQLMHSDKKAREGKIRMVLPTQTGSVETRSGIDQDVFRKAWEQAFELTR